MGLIYVIAGCITYMILIILSVAEILSWSDTFKIEDFGYLALIYIQTIFYFIIFSWGGSGKSENIAMFSDRFAIYQ